MRKGMRANRKLSRAVSDVGFFEFRRQLEYKVPMYGGNLFIVSRWFPSTKACSKCGCVKDMPLSTRTYKCEHCGNELDRDFNAALNLERQISDKTLAFALPKVLREVKPVDRDTNWSDLGHEGLGRSRN